MNKFLQLLRATGQIYYRAAANASRGCIKNYAIFPGILLLGTGYLLLGAILRPLAFGTAGILFGIIIALSGIAALSFYYSWVAATINKQALRFKELWDFDYSAFSAIISVAFIFFIVSFAVQQLTQGTDAKWLNYSVKLIIVIVFNAIPEVILFQRQEGIQALASAASFTKENWIEWFLPLLIVLLPILYVGPSAALLLLSTSNPLLPAFVIVEQNFILGSNTVAQLPMLLAAFIAFHWFSLFRASLFHALSNSSKRNRIFLMS